MIDKNNVIIMLGLVALFFAGSHLHDVAGVIYKNSLQEGKEYLAVNGFYNIETIKMYHIGWYMMYFAFIVLIIMYVTLLDKKK